MKSNLEVMETFTEDSLPSLKVAVLGALELFRKEKLKQFSFDKPGKYLVVGSGNAITTGKIIFSHLDCYFASESDYESFFNKDFSQ